MFNDYRHHLFLIIFYVYRAHTDKRTYSYTPTPHKHTPLVELYLLIEFP